MQPRITTGHQQGLYLVKMIKILRSKYQRGTYRCREENIGV